MSKLDTADLISRIRMLRDEVVLAVATAIGTNKFVRPNGRLEWIPDLGDHPGFPKDRDGTPSLPTAWAKLEKKWRATLSWRIPPAGTAESVKLEEVIQQVRECASLSRTFRPPLRRAAYSLVDVYIQPFSELEQMTLNLATKSEPVGAFLAAYTPARLKIEAALDGRQGIFVSINHGAAIGCDNPEVDGVAYMLKQVELKYDNKIVFCWARDEEFQSGLDHVPTHAWLLMHACQTAACFFTKSNQEEKKTPHNPNVCLELGAAIALHKNPGIFFARGSHDPLRRQIGEFTMIKGRRTTSYEGNVDLQQKIIAFVEDRLDVRLEDESTTQRPK